ncbi:Fluconazole resistance protein 1 [Exophiala xenobiotica]|uniref:Fluconazole resistance protein 1 n=1 Tax=Vermiconidia calcicola TaxID=1690605 RepID=A0AAV9PPX8_9PEZI|nr:Fluconazole resistance protein 1 [Exophiala xenobiotica]KAK5425419.1 Fluconazole resistance protein 1 [Exophiala xenobiotica]KAK5527546.1 Fluconazole resistance protein 1 [Vermiconidia calcicola]KAK5528532.1 hypothetical protein LTR23_010988 [Chaetothyriales sp. CCFEE 6169]
MLERQQVQLVAGLQELYKRWPGATLRETSDGMPLTHDILERLGALRQNSNAKHDTFEDAFSGLQQRLIAEGDDLTQRQPLHDSNPHPDSSAPSTIHEPVAQKPNFTNPFNLEPAGPSTPRKQTPYPEHAQHIHCMEMHIRPHVTNMRSNPSWNNPISALDFSMDFGNQFDSQMMDWPVDGTSFFLNAFRGPKTPAAINPHLTMYDWAGQEDPQQYLNSAMLA